MMIEFLQQYFNSNQICLIIILIPTWGFIALGWVLNKIDEIKAERMVKEYEKTERK